jgi:hypothetical protein
MKNIIENKEELREFLREEISKILKEEFEKRILILEFSLPLKEVIYNFTTKAEPIIEHIFSFIKK